MDAFKGKNLVRAIGNSSHPRYAAPGEAEGESQGRIEWITPAQRERLIERSLEPKEVRIGVESCLEHWRRKQGKG